ncbi:ankyrin repeat-containing protein [Spatholobus suberectus]|nr:ankyrin repeat-containing protein [Spatholobus suberectus]
MGCTALDMLMDAGIKNSEKNQTQSLPSTAKSVNSNEKYWRKFFKSSKKFLQHQGKRLEEMRGMLSLVATMISTMTYDAIMNLNPPDAITVKKTPNGEGYFVNNPPSGAPHIASNHPNIVKQDYFTHVIMFNSISFVTSLSITLLLVSGVPLKNEVTMGILSIGTGVTLTFLMLSYIYGVLILDPSGLFTGSEFLIFLCWIGLLGLIAVFTSV